MGRYRGVETPTLRKKLLERGLGQGTLAEYQPWIRVGDFPNRGESVKIACPKTGRTHHALSLIEYRAHLLAERDPLVKDIREQMPAGRITESLALAEELRIAHPSFGGEVITITYDLLLTVDDNRRRYYIARSMKYVKDLAKPRVQELLRLEQTLAQRNGVQWELWTDRELTHDLGKNLRWMRQTKLTSHDEPSERQWKVFVDIFLSQDFGLPMRSILAKCCQRMAISWTVAITLLKYCLFHGHIRCDLREPLQLCLPHAGLKLNSTPKGARRAA